MGLRDHARRAADLLSGGLTLLRSALPTKGEARPRVLIPGVDYPAGLGIVGQQELPVYGTADWKMPQVQQALDGIKVGSLQAAHQLMLQMQEDPLVAHGMALRVGSLVGTPFELVRPEGLPAAAYQALVTHWPECFSDGDLATSAEYRVMLGVAPAQVTWHLKDDLWMPRIRVQETGNLLWYPMERRFHFSSLDRGQIVVEDDGREWVLFCALAAKLPYLYGALRSLAVVWWIKQACLRYLHNFARVHGSPIRKVKAPASQRESQDFKALIEQAQTLFGGGVFTAPIYDGPSFDLELVEAQSQGHDVFSTAIRLCDEYITLRLLGAVDNTSGLSGQGSRARAEVHERQAVKFLGTDCRVTAAALTRVLRQWTAFNRFPVEWAPIPRFDHAPPADQSELADVRAKNAQAFATIVQVLLPTPAPAPAAGGPEALGAAPAAPASVQAALQEQAPDVQIDWRRLLEQHGVPLLQPDEAVAAAVDPAELEGVQLLIGRGARRSGAGAGSGGGGTLKPGEAPPQRDQVGHFFGKDVGAHDLVQAFSGGGLTAHAEHPPRLAGQELRASYRLVDGNGQGVGTIQREFSRTPQGLSVYHALFTLSANVQGKGTAREILANSVKFYRKTGVKEITVTAGLDKGKYAWAHYGFQARPTEVAAYRQAFVQHLQDKGLHQAATRAAGITKMSQIADFRAKGQRVGKEFLLSPTARSMPMWHGTIRLDRSDPGYRRLRRILAKG